MANKDGFRLERICVGAQEKWRVLRSSFSRNAHEEIHTHIHIYIHNLPKMQDVFASKD
jgi:hypothetical protein